MKIAFLGWGSLIWCKRNLCTKDEWKNDGPQLPVEFARISQDGRLTLVIVDNVKPVNVLWCYAKTTDLKKARYALKERECTTLDNIGYLSIKDNEYNINVNSGILDIIINWAKSKSLDAVVWTDLSSNFEQKYGKEFNVKNALKYLKSLSAKETEKAKEYIQKAPSQIRTPVREKVEEELGWCQNK